MTAADCYRQVQAVSERVEQLHAAGCPRMADDPRNTTWTDVDDAVQAALASLDVATQALAWMETVPTAHLDDGQQGGAR